MASESDQKDRVIAVCGATGQQGTSVINALLARKNFSVVGLTRHPEGDAAKSLANRGIQIRKADMDDVQSLTEAFSGVYGVFIVTTPFGKKNDTRLEVEHGKHAIEAAKAAQVSHVVFSSVGSADKNTGIPHFDSKAEIERLLAESGLAFSIVRPTFFYQNLISDAFGLFPKDGKVAIPRMHVDKKLQMIDVADIGYFVSIMFENFEEWKGKAIDLAGDELTPTEIAESLQRVTGHLCTAHKGHGAFLAHIKDGDDLARMYDWFDHVGYQADIAKCKEIFPRLQPLEPFLVENRPLLTERGLFPKNEDEQHHPTHQQMPEPHAG